MPPEELTHHNENAIVPGDNAVSHEADTDAEEGAQTVSRSKVRVLQYSRSDLLI